MRNGDYYPSRMDQQLEAAQFIINLKRQSNVENSISILTMGAPSPKVMISLSSDQSKLFHALNTISISGEECNLFSALNVAQLVLKHRQNPNQRQRVILFVGSALPREEGTTKSNEKTSEKGKEKEKEKENRFLQLAKIFKKNNICVDVIAFGEEQEDNYNVNLLNEFVETIVGGPLNKQTSPDTSSNIVVIPVDGDLSISEAVRSSGIIGSQGSMVSNDFGIDPDMDPELAMALKLSMEEEQARLAKQNNKSAIEESGSVNVNNNNNNNDNNSLEPATGDSVMMDKKMDSNDGGNDNDQMEGDDDPELAAAIAMSLEQQKQQQQQPDSNKSTSK